MKKRNTILTELDKKILYYLDYNAKASLTEISDWVGTSPQVVKYRMENLVERGVIKNFLAFCDYNLCGYPIFWGYWISFQGLTEEMNKEFFKYLEKHPSIPIIMKSSGYADVMIAIITKDIFAQDDILLELLEKFSPHVYVKEVLVGISFFKLGRKYMYSGEKSLSQVNQSGTNKALPDLDELDHKLLSIYQLHGRVNYEQVSKVLDIPSSTIRKRYESLTDKGVILNTTYTLGYPNIGVSMQRNLLRLSPNKEEGKKFFQYCKSHPNIVSYIRALGQSNLVLDIEAESPERFREIKQEILYNFPDLIKQYVINDVYEIIQFSQMKIQYPEIASQIESKSWKIN